MTDSTDLPSQEHALRIPAAANRIARCRFCFTLNEYVEGSTAPLCTTCGLDMSVPAHLRPLDVEVLLAQLGHEPTRDALSVGAPAEESAPSMLEQLLEEAGTPANGTGHLEPVPGTVGLVAPAPAVVSLAPLAPAQVAPIAPPPAAQVSLAPEVDIAAMTVAVRPEPEDIDNTVMVSRSSATNCVLVLPDGSEYPLSTDTIVGRRPEASPHVQTLALPDPTRTLSRTHARIWYDGTHWCLEDLGAVNGVSVLLDGDTEVVLEPGVATPLVSPRFRLGTLDVSLAVPAP